MLRVITTILALGLVWPVGARGGDVSVIAGEPALLDVLRDAQRAKAGAFPHGEMRVVVTQTLIGADSPMRRVEARVRWDGDECHATGTVGDYSPKDRKMDTGPFELLYNKRRRIFYLSDVPLMRISKIEEGRYPPLTRLRPDEWWFGNVDGGGFTFLGDLDRFVQRDTEILRHCRIERLDGNRVELSRDGGGRNPGRFRSVYGLIQDGNLLEQEKFYPNGMTEQRQYLWERAKGGGWYPKTISITRRFPPRARTMSEGYSYRYEVLSLDATLRPPKSVFSDSAIKAAPGTDIYDGSEGPDVAAPQNRVQ